MKILSVISKGYPIMGGAQTTNIAFLKKLSKRFRHDCRIYTSSFLKKTVLCDGIRITTFRDIDELQVMIQELNPDVILSTLEVSHDVIRVAKKYNLPVVVRIGGFEYCPPTTGEKAAWGLSLNKEYPKKKERDCVLREADTIVTASCYLKKRMQDKYSANSKVIFPEFMKEALLPESLRIPQKGYITGSCGFAYKGADIFYRLAKIFKDEKFLLIGTVDYRYVERFRQLNNVIIADYSAPKKFLAMSKIVLVPSQCPEGFGRIAVEAMASGIPVLASFTGGLKEIVKRSSLGVYYFRSVAAWRKKLATLLLSEKQYALNSREGRTLSKKFLEGTATEELHKLIKNVVRNRRTDFNTKGVIAICGDAEKKTAYSSINSQWSRELKKEGDYTVINLKNTNEFYNHSINYFIHHDYARDFKTISAPDEGKFIAVRTWDFGPLPPAWVEKINRECDQLWVYSNWVRRQAIKSGINASRVKVIAPGVDVNIFKPGGGRYVIRTKKRFKFIFVGAPIVRKGIDILLKAYGETFSASDDVCLVIKDNPEDVFYSGSRFKSRILKCARDERFPEVVYIDKYLSRRELASLYRACDVGVFPYKAEGFAMPIIEVMACGIPPIVPHFGACLDFCSPANSFFVPVKRINVPVSGDFAINSLGFREKICEVDFCEINPAVLAKILKKAFDSSKNSLYYKSRESVKTVQCYWTWARAAKKIKEELKSLDASGTPIRLKKQRLKYRNNAKKFKTAQKLFLDSRI